MLDYEAGVWLNVWQEGCSGYVADVCIVETDECEYYATANAGQCKFAPTNVGECEYAPTNADECEYAPTNAGECEYAPINAGECEYATETQTKRGSFQVQTTTNDKSLKQMDTVLLGCIVFS